MMKKKIFVLFVLGFFASFLWAKTNLSCKYLTISEGLSQNSVFSIFQDSRGYLWFGTEDGLNRYDGTGFEVFRYNPEDSNSLTQGTITVIREYGGFLWIGTDYGLNRFDPDTGRVERFTAGTENSISNDLIQDLCPDNRGNLWIATSGGLNRFDLQRNRFFHYRNTINDRSSISSDQVLCLTICGRGDLWIGTDKGLNRYNTATGDFTVFDDQQGLEAGHIRTLFEDTAGHLWLGTEGGGLIRFDKKDRFESFRPEAPSLRKKTGTIRKISGDERGNLWLITPGYGFFLFTPETGVFTEYSNESGNISSWIDKFNLSILKDSSGDMWMGTWSKGVCRFSSSNFYHYLSGENDRYGSDASDVFSICETADGSVLAGTYSRGVIQIDLITGETRSLIPELSREKIYSIMTDRTDPQSIWIGTWDRGLYRFNLESRTLKNYRHAGDDPESISSNAVRCLFMDDRDRVWAGTEYGLNLLDPAGDRFKRFLHSRDDPGSISHHSIVTVFQDRANRIWIGTEKGLNRLNENEDRFIPFFSDPEDTRTLGSSFITAMAEDNQGNLWVGTAGGGLNRYESEQGIFKRYLTGAGLPSNTIMGMLTDSDHYLWLSSNNGLVRFDPEKESFRIFRDRGGLQSTEFNLGAQWRARGGKLIFGGINGITVFNPHEVRTRTFKPPIHIKSITVYPEKLTLKNRPEDPLEVITGYRNRTISIEFISLDYASPGQNLYSYRINELHDNWIDLGNTNTITVTNLESGEYTLDIRGSNSDGVWNTEVISLKIIVLPPFWKTVWFRVAVLLLFLALIAVWHRSRMKKQEIRLRSEAYADEFCRKYRITNREKEIIGLILEGKTNFEIEELLFISGGTVKNHIYNIFQKLNVKNRTQLAGLLSDWKRTGNNG